MNENTIQKLCSACGELKYLEEYYPDKRLKFGKASCCRVCQIKRVQKSQTIEYRREYRRNNLDKVHKWQADYRKRHPDRLKARYRRYYDNNTEKCREKARIGMQRVRDRRKVEKVRSQECDLTGVEGTVKSLL